MRYQAAAVKTTRSKTREHYPLRSCLQRQDIIETCRESEECGVGCVGLIYGF